MVKFLLQIAMILKAFLSSNTLPTPSRASILSGLVALLGRETLAELLSARCGASSTELMAAPRLVPRFIARSIQASFCSSRFSPLLALVARAKRSLFRRSCTVVRHSSEASTRKNG